MGLDIDNPFSGRRSNIDVPASTTKPGAIHDNPHKTSRRNSIEVKPQTLSNIVPSTQG